MKPSEAIKPISYLKAHASEVIRQLGEGKNKTIVITHNGEAKAVLQDIHVFEQTQESLAMLKILALSNKSLQAGTVKPVEKAFRDVRKRIRDHDWNEEV